MPSLVLIMAEATFQTDREENPVGKLWQRY